MAQSASLAFVVVVSVRAKLPAPFSQFRKPFQLAPRIQELPSKYSGFFFSEIAPISAHPASTRGTLGQSSGNVRRDAMDAWLASDEDGHERTAKARGPDSPTLGSSRPVMNRPAMVAKEPGTPGRARDKP